MLQETPDHESLLLPVPNQNLAADGQIKSYTYTM